MRVYIYEKLAERGLEELHAKNNQEIYKKIINFMEHNNLTTEDFFVGGSAGSSYMNYFVVQDVHDIDIFLMKDNLNPERTEGIDIIPYKAIENYIPDIVKKDGLYFASRKQAMVCVAIKALLYERKRSIHYFTRLFLDSGMSAEEFQTYFKSCFETHVFRPENIEIVKNKMNLLQKWCVPSSQIPFEKISRLAKQGICQGTLDDLNK